MDLYFLIPTRLQNTVIGVGGVPICIYSFLNHLTEYLGFRGHAEFRTLARLAAIYTYFCGLMFLDQRYLGEGLMPRSAGLAITLTTLAQLVIRKQLLKVRVK